MNLEGTALLIIWDARFVPNLVNLDEGVQYAYISVEFDNILKICMHLTKSEMCPSVDMHVAAKSSLRVTEAFLSIWKLNLQKLHAKY